MPDLEVAQIETIERDAWLDMYAAAPAHVAAGLGLEHQVLDDGALLISRALDNLQFNRLASLGVLSPVRQDTFDAAISAFDRAGVRNWVVHVAEGAPSLEEMCRRRGLVPHRRTWAKFVRGPDKLDVGTSLAIREIGPEAAAAFGSVAAQAYGLPPATAEWLAVVVGRPRWHCFMAFDGAVPVATGAVYVDGTSAWLGIGATLASHRGRGAQSAVLAARIQAAAHEGCTTLTTETGVPHPGESGPSYGNIQRAGFRIAYLRPNFCRP
ncbi:MAG: GNAT family N-acetyltransferase [Hyphomicrobiaceae bacterium]|nr:MAG: GNAT family N-acetyltransferase [Hyphomicrobiaceae bacterium]